MTLNATRLVKRQLLPPDDKDLEAGFLQSYFGIPEAYIMFAILALVFAKELLRVAHYCPRAESTPSRAMVAAAVLAPAIKTLTVFLTPNLSKKLGTMLVSMLGNQHTTF